MCGSAACWQEFTSVKSLLQKAKQMVEQSLEKVGAPTDRAESSEEKLLKLRSELLRMALEPFLACTAALQDVHRRVVLVGEGQRGLWHGQ